MRSRFATQGRASRPASPHSSSADSLSPKPSRSVSALACVVAAASLSLACAGSSSQQSQAQPYPPQPYGSAPYGSTQPQGPYAQGPYAQGPYPAAPQQPTGHTPPDSQPSQPTGAGTYQQPATAAAADPISLVDTAYLRATAQGILAELVAALPAAQQGRVAGIPMVFDPEPGEVNAFAACTQQGRSLMAISDGLLDVAAHLAQAAANDEFFGTRKVDEYVALLARHQAPGQPLLRPAAGFFDPSHALDARRIARQHALFEEQVAFVLGHELAHHYLGHLPCTASGAFAVTASELNAALSGAVPLLNQPNELASDVAGTNNVLRAGARRTTGNRWTEGGGLLTMRFFIALEQLTPADVVFAFERSHPAALIRQPVIQQTAATYRATGGATLFPF